LKRDYALRDYLADIEGLNIGGSVFVEANAGASGASEVDWLDEVAGSDELPTVAVGSLDLRRPDVKPILSAFLTSSRMRGIRMSLCWDRRPQWRFIDRPHVMQCPEFRAGLSALTKHGLVFDALVMPGQLLELADLARENPDQMIVLNHLGTPAFESDTDRQEWADGIKACARQRNVFMKISGLWPLDRGWRTEIIDKPVRFVVDLFGPGRCMWASNLPVEKLMCPPETQVAHLAHVLGHLSLCERQMIFCATALKVYRIEMLVEAPERPVLSPGNAA